MPVSIKQIGGESGVTVCREVYFQSGCIINRNDIFLIRLRRIRFGKVAADSCRSGLYAF